ncbi:hypothetical protein PtB15_18B182 [Puccinia triticina]|nr:hypothetical protein PtB15_18B182 [Puccinia triticina]
MISPSVLVCLTPSFFDGFMALKATSPCRTSTWNLQNPNTVTWTSVATDPKKFDIVLVNNNPKVPVSWPNRPLSPSRQHPLQLLLKAAWHTQTPPSSR